MNVRDLGGLPTTDGGTTVPGRLLRSENLQELTPGDVARLVDEIGLDDGRGPALHERGAIEGPAPLDALAGVRHAHHPVLREFLDVSDTVKAALVTEAAQADRERYPDDPMCGHYLGYLENRPEEVVGALRSIATAPGAAIVHCAAGKDRTGVIVALALTVAGVEPEAVVADYAASDERIEAIIERLSRSKMYAGGVNGTPVRAHAPRAETMKAFLEQLGAALRRRGDLAGRQRVHRGRARPAPRQAQASVTAWSVPASSTFTTRSLSPTSCSRMESLIAPLGIAIGDWLAEWDKMREDRDRGKLTIAGLVRADAVRPRHRARARPGRRPVAARRGTRRRPYPAVRRTRSRSSNGSGRTAC